MTANNRIKENPVKYYALVLFVVSLVAACVMSIANMLTRDIIAEEIRKEFLHGLQAVLPPFDNSPDEENVELNGYKVYIAKNSGKLVGYGVSTTTNKGYGGAITVLVGADIKATITGVVVLQHAETPGLGDKITLVSWTGQFVGGALSKKFAVKADNGDIDQFSGATISPRAVCDAVNVAATILQKVSVK
ncbi:Na+-translocating ferredoxin:NAD+ oxidoreductase RNF, RnfG subunit [Deferribacterales bacterium RsTz2092]|nr:electron transport complex subunit G [Deferribacterales bacterium]